MFLPGYDTCVVQGCDLTEMSGVIAVYEIEEACTRVKFAGWTFFPCQLFLVLGTLLALEIIFFSKAILVHYRGRMPVFTHDGLDRHFSIRRIWTSYWNWVIHWISFLKGCTRLAVGVSNFYQYPLSKREEQTITTKGLLSKSNAHCANQFLTVIG